MTNRLYHQPIDLTINLPIYYDYFYIITDLKLINLLNENI